MNRKEATLIAIVGMAIFATVMATSSSTQALASVEDTSNNGVASDGNADDSDSSTEANDDLQACLSDKGVEESPTKQQVQDCMDPYYNEDYNDGQSENTDNGDEDENGNTEDEDNDDSEEDEWE